MDKMNQPPRLLLAAGVIIVGAAFIPIPYVEFVKLTKRSRKTKHERIIVGQEDPYSLGCCADDRSSPIMSYVNTDNALTPSASSQL